MHSVLIAITAALALALPGSKAPKLTPLQKKYKAAVTSHINESRNEISGEYSIFDPIADIRLEVTLKRFQWSQTRDLNIDEKIVSVEFAEGSRIIIVDYDLRFQFNEWQVTAETIISIDGDERFIYDEKHVRIPVGRSLEFIEREEQLEINSEE